MLGYVLAEGAGVSTDDLTATTTTGALVVAGVGFPRARLPGLASSSSASSSKARFDDSFDSTNAGCFFDGPVCSMSMSGSGGW